jgi:glucose-1-phosphate cytidylyltransferase
MKVVILAGGFGTRLAEHTAVIPKPMVEIGGRPIIWHIMNSYAEQGFTDFVIALGYKGSVIKDYFSNYKKINSDFTVDLATGEVHELGAGHEEKWTVTLIDTGQDVMTGGRLLRLKAFLNDGPFMLTYGDGLANVDVLRLVQHHEASKMRGTITAVHPKAHYGELDLDGDRVARFMEKPTFRQSWINGGFMVFNPDVFDLISGDQSILERDVLERLGEAGQLGAFRHQGFWQCMDTLRDVQLLNALWDSGDRPWTRS